MHSEKPFLLRLRSSKWLIAITIFAAIFTDGFVYGVIVPVTPFALVERIGVPEKDVQFWSSTFLAVFGGSSLFASPFVGWYTDRSSSRQKPFLSAIALGSVATIIYALAKNTALLVLGRCIQGISVSVLFAVGLAHLVDTVGRDEVGQWIGFVLSGMNLGVMLSPFLGGLVYDKAGYHSVFIMCIGVLAFVFLLRISIIERGTAAKYEKVSSIGDEAGYGTCEAEEAAQSHRSTPSIQSDSRNSIDKGNLSERSATEPNEQDHLIPSSSANQQHPAKKHLSGFFSRRFPVMTALLTSPRILTVWFGCFVHIAVITAFDAVLPIFVRKTFGWHATGAGLIFLAVTIPAILGAAIGGLSDRYGPRRIALVGLVIATPSVALLGLVDHDGVGQIILLCFLLACTGIGLNLLLAPLASDMSFVVEQLSEDNPGLLDSAGAYAQAYSIFNSGLAAGMVVGPLWAGSVYSKTNWAIMNGTLAAVCALCSVPVALFTRPTPHRVD